MGNLSNDWNNAFSCNFETDEDVIEFISERIDTNDFEDSYVDAGGYGEPNEMFKVTASDKRTQLIDFLDYLVERKDRLENALKVYEDLESNEMLIKLPCKIGDIVYRVVSGFEPIREETVLSFEFNGYFVITITEYGRYLELDKIAFLTREEAENELIKLMKL